MAIQKMKWQELMTTVIPSRVVSSFTDLGTLVTAVYNLQKTMFGASDIKLIYDELMIMLCQSQNEDSAWKDMLIYTSSFKSADCRYVELLFQKAIEYAGFYKKILTDVGLQRSLVYGKTYTNNGSASSTERGTNSVTPQNSALYPSGQETEDELFDRAIADYASALDKNKSSTQTSSYGGSTTNVTGTTWEESKKNMQMIYYHELCNYLYSIPEKIYGYYSLDTMPIPELAKQFKNYIDDIIEMFETYE